MKDYQDYTGNKIGSGNDGSSQKKTVFGHEMKKIAKLEARTRKAIRHAEQLNKELERATNELLDKVMEMMNGL